MAWPVLFGGISKLGGRMRHVHQSWTKLLDGATGESPGRGMLRLWTAPIPRVRANRGGALPPHSRGAVHPANPNRHIASTLSKRYPASDAGHVHRPSRQGWSCNAALGQQQVYVPDCQESSPHVQNASATLPRTLGSKGFSTFVPSNQPLRLTSDFLAPKQDPSAPIYLVLLNYHLPHSITSLWHKATYKLCADGGANQLYDHLPSFVDGDPGQLRGSYWPDAIVGDLDSIREDVHAYYQEGGSLVVDLSSDQDSTDATKCVMHLEQKVIPPGASHTIVVMGALGGRLDHTLANLNTLHRFPHLNIVLLGEGNMARLIRPGCTVIHPAPEIEGPQCGLVPLLYPAVVSTSGLKWNVDRVQLSMSGLISTSNMIGEGPGEREVWVETNNPLVWVTQISCDRVE